MEPIATAFATLVSLIGQYRSERGAKYTADFQEFLTWLIEIKHKQLKEAIESNSRTATGVKVLLHEKFESLQRQLDAIDGSLAAFASGLPGFSEIVSVLHPNAELSKQALHILRQIHHSTVEKVLKSDHMGGSELLCIGGDTEFDITEPRFLEDDLQRLVELGLMRMDYTESGDPLYIFTRAASQLVQAMESSTKNQGSA